jgi:hypothetical protein
MARRYIPQLLMVITALFFAACGGPLFKVKPASQLPPIPATSNRAEAGGVNVRVAPLLTDEESQELFEANLPVSGIVPIRVEIDFQSDAAVDIKKLKFKLIDSQSSEFKLLSTKSAVSRIMKQEEITLYNPYSKKQFESDLGAYALDLKTPLSSGTLNRRGFLFFQSPYKSPVRNTKLTLIVERLPQPLSIQVN